MRSTALAALAMVMSLNTPALATECYRLDLKLSGSLNDSMNGFEIELPVNSLGNGAAAGLSFERTAPGIWSISLIRPAQDDFHVSKVTFVNIVDGKQVAAEQFGFQLHSNDPSVAQSSVVVSLADFTDVGERGIIISDINKISFRCITQGAIDTRGEVNGGVINELLVGIHNVPEGYLYEPASPQN